MKSFAIAVLVGTASALVSSEFEYMQHLALFNRSFTSINEFHERLSNFKANDDFIRKTNASNASWTAGHNKFSDWSEAEL